MFPNGQHIERDRQTQVSSPHNPARTVPSGTWTGAATVTLDDSWIGDPSIASLSDPARSATASNASLYCSADADVQKGDRLRCNGHAYIVQAVPMPVNNPFTGWSPPLEIAIEEVLDA